MRGCASTHEGVGDAVRIAVSRAFNHRHVGEVGAEVALVLDFANLVSVLQQTGEDVLAIVYSSFD